MSKKLMKGLCYVMLALGLQACSPKYYVSKPQSQQYLITKDLSQDSVLLAYYNPYKKQMDSIMNEIVVVSEKEISKDKPEGLLNDFFADAIADAAKDKGIIFDIAFSNYGGLRTSIPKGEVPLSKIFELMPFENALVCVKFSGKDMPAFFDFLAKSGGDALSGARFKIDRASGKAVDVLINGKPIDVDKEYIVLTSDYMANGGDGGAIFQKSKEIIDQNFLLRDALIYYVRKQNKQGKTLNPILDGRISYR
ncbi:5'-nucleotidase C-terminal domain-containing protein [Pseudopedobacter beijingensis]|uniref:5'-nucleotidase C-terminal domain-containing protein n=1 Tax=Pseudopedobacter beijingensis TaxID=1207056 RepID=A0ABW4IBP0_9SPHI